MNNTALGILVVLCSSFVAAVSQMLLKKSSKITYKSWWREYLNFYVLLAYFLFLCTTVFSVIALRFIPLSLSAAAGASGQIFVPVLSCIIYKERIGIQRMAGMAAIVIGILIFSI